MYPHAPKMSFVAIKATHDNVLLSMTQIGG